MPTGIYKHDLKLDKNPNWRGGRVRSKRGYIMIVSHDHPHSSKRDHYVKEHKLVMEKHLRRYLLSEERVHHINGIKDDNRIENLQLFKNHSEHMKIHLPKGKILNPWGVKGNPDRIGVSI